jgi:hypothetical protein
MAAILMLILFLLCMFMGSIFRFARMLFQRLLVTVGADEEVSVHTIKSVAILAGCLFFLGVAATVFQLTLRSI